MSDEASRVGGSRTDVLALAFDAVFIGSLVVAGLLLLFTYLAFVRMNKDVRRARLFIMAERVRRFLGAFTFGFLLIAAASALTLAGLPTAEHVFAVVIFLFLAAIVYGSLELFLIVRPRRTAMVPRRQVASAARAADGSGAPPAEEAGGEGPAPR